MKGLGASAPCPPSAARIGVAVASAAAAARTAITLIRDIGRFLEALPAGEKIGRKGPDKDPFRPAENECPPVTT
ncbi:MAG: hypothetical protein AMXMBFR83_12780 [Phycisphaerae bacterium]